jgi:voltage-gated potassium channel
MTTRLDESATKGTDELPIKEQIYNVIFKSDTRAGRNFDIVLLIAIVFSVFVVMMDSVESMRSRFGQVILAAEWFFTVLFTIEYVMRLYCVSNRVRYATSLLGVIDLMAILPAYLSLVVSGAHYLLVMRVLRMLRIFRIFKLSRYLTEADVLVTALQASREKITVFIGAVLTLVTVIGALMYLIEGPEHGFSSIPKSIYWAIVTLTTVGYGDMSPKTPPGQFLASIVMILGYGIIAVPTGIVTVELQQANRHRGPSTHCTKCGKSRHEPGSIYCSRCGNKL